MKRRRTATTAAAAFSRREIQALGGAVAIAFAASIMLSLAAQKPGPDARDLAAFASADTARPVPAARVVSAN